MEKEEFLGICNSGITCLVEKCKVLQKKYGNGLFEADETKDEFIKFTEKTLRFFDSVTIINRKNKPYIFFDLFITSYIKYIDNKIVSNFDGNPDNNRALATLFFSALNKYGVIINLFECEEYENGLIIFRSFYENMVIFQFLLNHKECLNDFEKYSTYKLKKLSKNFFFESLNKKEFKNIKDDFDANKMDKEYGWADKIIKEERITFKQIAEIVFEHDKDLMDKMRDMYLITSDLVHSNTCVLNDPYFKDALNKELRNWLSTFAIQTIRNNFYALYKSMYDNKLLFDMEIFNEVCKYILFLGKPLGS